MKEDLSAESQSQEITSKTETSPTSELSQIEEVTHHQPEDTVQLQPDSVEIAVQSDEDDEVKSFIANLSEIDFNSYSKEELKSTFRDLLAVPDVHVVKDIAEEIRSVFYKKHSSEKNDKLQAFLASGGVVEDFEFVDPLEGEFKILYNKFKDIKTKINEELDREKNDNLRLRNEIIEEIKELINKEESIEQTFEEFRQLQERWKRIGIIPQSEVKNIWETYHHNVSKFYDYIKINKELRDLDLKKNLEAKISLCEHAESLILEAAVVKAFAELQKLHEQWREIGPVPHEKKDEIWIRFKNATTQINKNHQDYFLQMKELEKSNLEAKVLICEKIEELAQSEIKSPKDWTDKSKEIIEIQKVWRTIGFAPKKHNNQIYERFRNACDAFFNRKRDFFQELKSEEEINKQKKTDLCIQAESLKDSTDWKNTTNELIAIQKEWKKIGVVPKKDSDKLWHRFRAACDTFFNAKDKHFASLDSEQETNLQKKLALIAELEKLEVSKSSEETLEKLQQIQKEWTEIGFIPLKMKDKVNNQYRDLISKKFEGLNLDDKKTRMFKYKVKLEGLKNNKSDGKFKSEKSKLITKLKTLQNDVVLLENNIGFFSKSNKAGNFIKDVQEKIEKGKKDIELLKEQIRLLDDIDDNN